MIWYADADNLSLKNTLISNTAFACFYNPAKAVNNISLYNAFIYNDFSSTIKSFNMSKKFFSSSYQKREIENMNEEIFSLGFKSLNKIWNVGLNYNYYKQKISSFQNTASFLNISGLFSFAKFSFSYSAINLLANFTKEKLPFYHLWETKYLLSSQTTLGLSYQHKQDNEENFIFSSKYEINKNFAINNSYETKVKTLGFGLSYQIKNFISSFSFNYFQENKPTIGFSFSYEI